VLTAVEAATYDLLLMDLNYTGDTTSGREGIDLLTRVQRHDSLLPVVVMTGWGSVDLAVEAMRRGVRDFVQKPWDNAHLVSMLRTEIDRGRERRERHSLEQRELDEARRIQRKLLPAALPEIDGCEIAVSCQPASGVGGDCFDALAFSRTSLAISISDVVGRGIPAALLMSNLQAAVRAFATAATEPADLCRQVNRILCGNIADGRFISFFYCVVDAESGAITYANAGHCPPMLIRGDGAVERLTAGGPVLGVSSSAVYEQGRTHLTKGDRLLLFTDGMSEARRVDAPAYDADGYSEDEFGEARFVDLAVGNRACSAPALQARLTESVAAFTGGTFRDDATLIVLAGD
jgi:sigma-B regulation protein RsbU (phosphoserine phosphatase)